jgi:PAS domain-containing protein
MDSKDPLSIIDNGADSFFVVDARHQLIAWSTGCENLLGFDAQSVLGEDCYRIVCGTDAFGNRFCDAHCAVLNMVRHGEAVNAFELNLRTATGSAVRANISIFVVGQTSSQFALFHFLNPVERVNNRSAIEA